MSKKEYRNTMSIPAAVGVGTVISTIVMLIGAIVITLLVSNELISDQSMDYGVLALTMLSAILGCSVSNVVAKRRLLIVSVCTAVTFLLVLISITAIFYGGQYSAIPVTALVILGGGVSSVLIIGKTIYKTKTNYKRAKL